MGDQLAPTERHAFRHEGRVVYEWDQTLEEVNMYVEVPPGVTAKVLAVRIDTDEVAIGIRGNPPYLEHRLTERVKTEECYWTLEDGELHLQLGQRRRRRRLRARPRGHAGREQDRIDPGAIPGERLGDAQPPAEKGIEAEFPGREWLSPQARTRYRPGPCGPLLNRHRPP